jgi:hypothetical protein
MKFKANNPAGDTVKGDVLLFVNEKDAQEFNTPARGNKFSSYVLTAPKDILTVRTAVTLEDGVEEFSDIVVDGVLRSTSQIKKGKGKKTVDKAIFDKVLFYRYENGKKRGLKVGQMEVASRDSPKGTHFPVRFALHRCLVANVVLNSTLREAFFFRRLY